MSKRKATKVTKAEIEKARKAIDTPQVYDLVVKWLAAHAKARVMREEVDKIEAEALAEIPIYADYVSSDGRHHDDGSRLTSGKQLYRSQDTAACYRFYAECNWREREAGLKPADMPYSHCPALVAEQEQLEIEWALIDAAGTPLGVTSDKITQPEMHKQFVDLVVGAIIALHGDKVGADAKKLLSYLEVKMPEKKGD